MILLQCSFLTSLANVFGGLYGIIDILYGLHFPTYTGPYAYVFLACTPFRHD